MGGHGGLNILPQKRWNVYNFDNREKVKRDEEKAAREEAIQRQQDRQREADLRLEKLREVAQAKREGSCELRIADGEGTAEQPLLENEEENEVVALAEAERAKHFNLFEIAGEPEQGAAKPKGSNDWINDLKVGTRGGLDKQDIRELKKMEKSKDRAPEDEGYEFGCGLVGKSGKKPWYATKRFMVDRTGEGGTGSRTSKSRSPVEERPSKRSRTSDEKSGRSENRVRKDKKEKSGRKSMEELRAERARREQQERDRAQKLLLAKSKLNGDGVYGVNRSGRPYYHQSFGNAR